MSQDGLFGAPAGWYPDPLGLPQLRWWNNHAWTEQTSAARQPMVVQDTKFAWADDELPRRRDERERGRYDRTPAEPVAPTAESLRELDPPRAFTQVSQGVPSAPTWATSVPTEAPAAPTPPAAPRVESLYVPDPVVEPAAPAESAAAFGAIFDTKPAAAPDEALNALFGEKEGRKAGTAVKTPIVTADQLSKTSTAAAQSNTGPVWMIATIPLLQIVLSILLLNSLGMGGSQFIYLGILVLPYFLVIGLAYLDSQQLVKAGHKKPAHWAWAVLTAPVYLLVRARSVIAETGHGIGPVVAWFGLGALQLASLFAVPGVIVALMPAVFTGQIEESVQHDAMLIAGTSMVVDCPAAPPVLPGETIVCQSVSGSNNTFDITVAFERSNGWIAWQVVDWGSFSGS